jgi:hypothetical protein
VGDIHQPAPVKLIVGLLASREAWLDAAAKRLAACFGPVDLASDPIPFTFTDYYAAQMGVGLLRKFVAHQRLIPPDDLASIKVRTNALEAELAADLDADVPRPVNLDPGLLEGSKLVLASTKDQAHRIYLGQGIYAEITLTFCRGEFVAAPWTYRDYRTDAYHAFLKRARERYLHQRKEAPS